MSVDYVLFTRDSKEYINVGNYYRYTPENWDNLYYFFLNYILQSDKFLATKQATLKYFRFIRFQQLFCDMTISNKIFYFKHTNKIIKYIKTTNKYEGFVLLLDTTDKFLFNFNYVTGVCLYEELGYKNIDLY